MPEPEDDSPYHIPLPELTGTHGYAVQRGEDDDEPLDPGAPVAYVAEPMTERPNALTIEGAIKGIGDAAYGAAKQGGSSRTLMRVIAAGFIVPILAGVTAWVWERF
ncbi:MAG TPA: hypothetical protein VGX28_09850 [Frankiaceae bacterium]|nr:hypothetical protein [Frankiaceae bacterium]